MLVLAALAGEQEPPATLSALAVETGLPVSAVHRSLAALQEAQLVDASRGVKLAQMDEFCAHALRYVFPPHMAVRRAASRRRGRPRRSATSSHPRTACRSYGRIRRGRCAGSS